MPIRRLSIIGVGLLGGSIGLAVKSSATDCKIIGYAHRSSTRSKAMEMGAIDEAPPTLADAVADADLIILCTPVGLFESNLREIAQFATPGAVVTDVGSTKRSVVRLAEEILPASVRFVGSHPMAGSEKRGVEFAKPDLFRGARCIITPTPRTHADALATVEQFWADLGMRLTHLDPAEHDRLVCQISHLPHAVAAALVAMQEDAALPLAGRGFLDTTRVAGGDGGLWRDIFLDNADNLRESVSRLRSQLDEILARLTPDDGESLRAWLDAAARRREQLVQDKLRELNLD